MTAETPAQRIWAFGSFALDLSRGALLREGVEVRLRPKSFAVLAFLVERHNQVVTRDELLKGVWGHTAVTDGAVTQVLMDIRRVLGDDAQRMIRTVPKRGYRFDVPVSGPAEVAAGGDESPARATPSAPARPETPRSRPGWRTGLIAGLAVAAAGLWWGAADRETDGAVPVEAPTTPPADPSVAVLPFVDLSPEGDQAYFSDGLAEELLNVLAQVPGLRVIARTSSFSFKDQNVDVATIARRLDVNHVLEGSVRKWENRVRITAQLVETASSSHLWSATYDRDLDDLFAIQDEIAAAVADALEVALADDLERDGSTENARALEHYLQGRYYFNRRGPGDVARARAQFERAVAADPGYGQAWAGLAAALQITLIERELPGDEIAPAWTEAVTKALNHAPESPETLFRAANHAFAEGKEEEGMAYRSRFLAARPRTYLTFSVAAGLAFDEGRVDEAIGLARQAVALDPVAATHHNNLASFLAHAGRYEEATAAYREALALSPANAEYERSLTFILVLHGRPAEALPVIEAWPEGEMRDAGLALAGFPLGRHAEAEAALQRLKAATTASAALRVAEVAAQRGDADEAFRWLDTAFARAEADAHPVTGFGRWRIGFDAADSWFLKSVHDDPRWKAW